VDRSVFFGRFSAICGARAPKVSSAEMFRRNCPLRDRNLKIMELCGVEAIANAGCGDER
jgi:hypothetical protein